MSRDVRRCDAPAYPSHGTMGEVVQVGLTIREHFAAMAMAQLAAHHTQGSHTFAELVAKQSVEYADALLAELSKP